MFIKSLLYSLSANKDTVSPTSLHLALFLLSTSDDILRGAPKSADYSR